MSPGCLLFIIAAGSTQGKKKRGKTLQSWKEPGAHGQSPRPTVPREDGTTRAGASDKRDFYLRRAGEWRGSYKSGQSTAGPGEALRPVHSRGQGQLRAPTPGQPPLSPAGCRSGLPSPNTRCLRLGAESWPAPTAHLQVAARVLSALLSGRADSSGAASNFYLN